MAGRGSARCSGATSALGKDKRAASRWGGGDRMHARTFRAVLLQYSRENAPVWAGQPPPARTENKTT